MHTLPLLSPALIEHRTGYREYDIYVPRIDNLTDKLFMLRVWEKASMQVW